MAELNSVQIVTSALDLLLTMAATIELLFDERTFAPHEV